MKKIWWGLVCYLLALSSNTFAINSVVPLAGSANVAAATTYKLPLTGLISAVNYSVVCYIDTSFSFQYILLSSQFADSTSTVSSYSLNGNYVTQAQLIPGHNIVVVNGNFTNPNTDLIVFTNLDQTNPFNVNNCFAVPI